MNFVSVVAIFFLCIVVSVDGAWVKEMENKGMFEGDIILDPDEREAGWNVSRRSYASIRGGRWPGGVVPYEIQGSILGAGRRAIAGAIENYHRYTCIRWKPRTTERTYVSFYRGSGCSSPVGFRYGRVNTISLAAGCWHTGVTMHEMGHTLGFFHEQSRPDRDSNVRIIWNNITPGMAYNFNKQSTQVVDSLGTPYDFGSMMHYGTTAFGIGGRMTIQTIDPRNQNKIGNRAGFSPIDIVQLNLMYKCGPLVTTVLPVPTAPPTEGPMTRPAICDNQKVHCLAWASQGYCKGEFERYMNKYCCKACEDLGKKTGPVTAATMLPATVTAPSGCVDKYGFCTAWAKEGKCHGEFEKFMKLNCCKACYELAKKTTGPVTSIPTTMAPTGGKPATTAGPTGGKPATTVGPTGGKPATTVGPTGGKPATTIGPTGGKPATTVKAATMLPAKTSVPPPPECVNKFGFCTAWAKEGKCHGKFMKFMILNCCRACADLGKAKTTSAPPKTEPKECVDEDENCPSWASSGECEKNPDWMKQHCRKSCHVC